MLNIPAYCKFRVADRDELFSILEVLERHDFRWSNGVRPTEYVPINTYGLCLCGRIITRFPTSSGYHRDNTYPKIHANMIFSNDQHTCTLQDITGLF